MTNEDLKHLVSNQIWNNTDIPDYLTIEDVKVILNKIIDITPTQDSNSLGEEILRTIGNNHRGTFFPIAEEAIDILVTILEYSQDNPKRKTFILGLLNDLYYFDLDLEFKDNLNFLQKKKSIKTKLEKYSDENFSSV